MLLPALIDLTLATASASPTWVELRGRPSLHEAYIDDDPSHRTRFLHEDPSPPMDSAVLTMALRPAVAAASGIAAVNLILR